MNRACSIACAMLLAGNVLNAVGAGLYTETFSMGANGWSGSTKWGSGLWAFTGGVARVYFFPGFPPPGELGTLSNAPTASSGSFTGNYTTAGIKLVGFRFMAPEAPPSGLVLELGGPTSVYQRTFSTSATGVWQTFSASLASRELGGWTNLAGPVADFDAVLQDVRYVLVRVVRDPTDVERSYLVDDIYLARLPAAGGVKSSGGGLAALRGDNLLTDVVYNVESAPEVTGAWSVAHSFTATNSSQWIDLTNTAPRYFWRFVVPE